MYLAFSDWLIKSQLSMPCARDE